MDYNQFNGNRLDTCERCGSVKVDGTCPVCGAQKKGLSTAAKSIIAIASVILASVIYVVVLVAAQPQLLNANFNFSVGGSEPVTVPDAEVEASGVPTPPVNDRATGETDDGFYWPAWSDYVYNYENAAEADYGTIVDARDAGVSYEIRDFYFEYDGMQELALGSDRSYYASPSTTGMSVQYSAHYIQLEGDIPNLDEINNELRYWPLSGPALFLEWTQSDYDELYDATQAAMTYSQVRTFVTYNTEDFLSIAVVEEDALYGSVANYIVSINIDLKEGKVLELPDMATLDDAFMDVFTELGDEQFSDVSGYASLSREELLARLDGSNTYAVVFLQPNMVQIGYNYSDDYSRGWLAVEYPADRIPEDLLKYYAAPPTGA